MVCWPHTLLSNTLQAFLRIRPHLGPEAPSSPPYIEYISDVAVRMVDPYLCGDTNSHFASNFFRQSTTPTTAIYSFSRVFPPATQQSEFFARTTLPLVQGLLEGENGLLFTYGVTNSGKTYTVQGGTQEGTAGILPRTLDVIFNSIEGLQGNSRVIYLSYHFLYSDRRFPVPSSAITRR